MNITRNIIALALACSLGIGLAWAQGKRTTAELGELVQRGETAYYPAYAQRLFNGDETAVDVPKALELLEKSAQDNNPDGKFGVGVGHLLGFKEPSFAKALKLFEEASEGGMSSATACLGLFYDRGLGTKSNFYEALSQYAKVAPRELSAKCALAELYGDRSPFPSARLAGQCVNEALGSFAHYKGVPNMEPSVCDFLWQERDQSRILVIQKLSEPRPSLDKLSAMELYNWGMLYRLAVDMGTDIGAKGVKQSQELLGEAARRNFVLAKIALADGQAQSGSAEGLADLHKFADQGYMYAKIDLLKYYQAVSNKSQQEEDAYLAVLEDLAKIGYNPAYEMIAEYWAARNQDSAKTWECTLRSADAGNAASCYKVAQSYRTGQCAIAGVEVAKDPALAFRYLRSLCADLPYGDYSKLDMCQAFTSLGNMYALGIGTAADSAEALDWYNEALQTPRGNKDEATYRMASLLVKNPEKRTVGLEMLRQVASGKSEFAAGAKQRLSSYSK